MHQSFINPPSISLAPAVNQQSITALVVFNIRPGDLRLISEPARALMRHVFSRYYTDVVHVAKFGTTFKWQETFRRALLNYRDAALRWSHGIRRLTIHRCHTHQPIGNSLLAVCGRSSHGCGSMSVSILWLNS